MAVLLPLNAFIKERNVGGLSAVVALALLFTSRCWFTYIIIPWFSEGGWIFLRAIHYMAFEFCNGMFALVACGIAHVATILPSVAEKEKIESPQAMRLNFQS
jgi:hypothetical protein